MTAAPPGLEIEGVRFAYGARRALEDVSFSVPGGTFCALLGPNGAGKSTLFALISGLFASQGGRIAVAGQDVGRAPVAALRRLGILFQSSALDPDLGCAANLRYAAALHGLAGRAASAAVAAALDRAGLAERARDQVRTLSGGQRRRLEIARALMHGPAVLLLDEPTVGLDAAARAEVVAHVHALAQQEGIAVLWATHLTDEVHPGDRLVILDRGRLRARGTAAEVAGGRDLRQVFLALTAAGAAAETAG